MYKRWSCFTVQVFDFNRYSIWISSSMKRLVVPLKRRPRHRIIREPWAVSPIVSSSSHAAIFHGSTFSQELQTWKISDCGFAKILELRGCPQCDHAQPLDYQKPKWFRLCTRTTRWWKFDEPCSPFLRGIPIPILFNTCKQPNDQNQTNILYLHYSEIHRLCMDRPCIMTHWQWVGLM